MLNEFLPPDATIRELGWKNINRIAWPEHCGEGCRLGDDVGEFLDIKVFSHGVYRNILACGS